jgi:hypothetical protein
VGRPPHGVRRSYASFRYQAQSWSHSRRVVAKVEWHPGELYPRLGFLVTNLCRWSLTTLREKVIKIDAKVIAYARYMAFRMAEVAVPRKLFRRILYLINDLRPRQVARW